MTLAIAGVQIRLHSEVLPLAEPSPLYLPFLVKTAAGSPGPSAIDLVVRAETATPIQAPTIFESGGPWYLQRDGSGYRINLWPREGRPPQVVACSNGETTQVTVFDSRAAASLREGTTEAPAPAVENPVGYPLDQLLLMNHLAPLGGVIVHAAGAVIDGRAIVFAGASEAGKSTISQLLARAGLAASLLSDDRVILRLEGGSRVEPHAQASPQITAWGTPWAGDAQVASTASAPLGAILFLEKAEEDRIVPVDAASALRRLLPVVSVPWYDAELFSPMLDTCAQIVATRPCYELRFRPVEDVVRLLAGRSWAPQGSP